MRFSLTTNTDRRVGDRRRDAKEWEEAAAAYRRHLHHRPRDAAIWVQLGHCEKEAAHFDAAEAAYREAMAIAPTDPDPLKHLGHMLKSRGRSEDALNLFLRLLRLGSDPVIAEEVRLLSLGCGGGHATELGEGALLFALDDYLAAVVEDPGSETQRAQERFFRAAMAETVQAHFIVQDRGVGRGAEHLLAFDREAVLGIFDAAGSRRSGDALAHAITIGYLTASPVVAGSGSTLSWRLVRTDGEIEPWRYLAALDRGVKLALYAPDATWLEDVFRHGSTDGPWRSLAEMLFVADIVVAGSAGIGERLTTLCAASPSPPPRIAIVAPEAGDAVAVAELGAVTSAITTDRATGLVTLEDGVALEPSASGATEVGDLGFPAYAANPLGLLLGRSFSSIPGNGAAWMRGKRGDLAFRIDAASGTALRFVLALEAGPSMAGRRLSIAPAATPPARRRWTTLVHGSNPVRLDDVANDDGICHLTLTLDDAGPPEREGSAIGIRLLGYYQAGDTRRQRSLRTRILFG